MADIEFQFKNIIYRLTDGSMTMHTKTLFGSEKLNGSVDITKIEILYCHPEEDKHTLHMFFTTPGRESPYHCEVPKSERDSLQQFYDVLIARGAVDRPMSVWKAGSAKHTLTKEWEEKQKAVQKAQAKEAAAARRQRESLRIGCKVKQEETYTCTRCGAVWFSNDDDTIRNFMNAANPNIFTLNQVKDFSKCPQCGSKATTHKKVKYWVDKKGNCVDMEE